MNKIEEHYNELYQKGAVFNKNRIQHTKSMIPLFLQHGLGNRLTVLDLGSGTGEHLQELSKHCFWNIICADISTEALKQAKQKGYKVKYVDLNSQYSLPKTDLTIMLETIEHVYSPKKVLEKLNSDWLLISTPNVSNWRTRYHILKGEIPDIMESEDHISFFNTRTLPKLLEETGWQIVRKKNITEKSSLLPLYHKITGRKHEYVETPFLPNTMCDVMICLCKKK